MNSELGCWPHKAPIVVHATAHCDTSDDNFDALTFNCPLLLLLLLRSLLSNSSSSVSGDILSYLEMFSGVLLVPAWLLVVSGRVLTVDHDKVRCDAVVNSQRRSLHMQEFDQQPELHFHLDIQVFVSLSASRSYTELSQTFQGGFL